MLRFRSMFQNLTIQLDEFCLGALTVLFLLGLILTSSGCSLSGREQAVAMNRVLNTLTDVADPAYGASVVACDAAEAFVNARHDTPEQEDADVANIHAECNRIFAAFEALRNAQLLARRAVAAAERGEVSIAEAITALDNLKSAYDAVRAAIEGGWVPSVHAVAGGER